MTDKFKTNAEIRRFLQFQKRKAPDASPRVWTRYCIFIECSKEIVTFNDWINR